jgi:hypothetical protein
VQHVYVGCKICGRQMLTTGSPRMHRTCDACKAIQKRERNRRTDAPQGRTPRRQSKNGSNAMRAVQQTHRGSQSPRRESQAAMGAQVLRQNMP